ncbi:unnamed protein product [Paramecium pentaurelia]|uniref:Dpy-30 motif protein n=1 Tax=Paramecium pentaurelia TaxID=43138 RepID=A0A8S1SGK3_9CILI|nr:unnamed protein product [Paramecium pentaurelia]
MSKRYFINNLDSPLGQEFYSQLVKEDTEEGVHMATYTIDDPNKMPPKGFKKILKRYKPKLSRKKMLEECDVYVYDVASATQTDLDFVCDIFRNSKTTLEEQKVLILVSSVLTWSAMPDKVKPKVEKKADEEQEGEQQEQQEQQQKKEEAEAEENQEPKEDENQDQEQDQQQIQQQQINEVPEIIEYVPWEESDYKLRSASTQYQQLKEWEDMVLGLQKENLKVIVVCSGLIYGKGELLFQKYFKKAWLQQPYKLSYQSDGNNKVPTVHITDLVKMIVKVSESIPESNYIFAVDNTQDRTQKAIIQGIATGVGSGWIEQNDDFFKDFTPEEMDCFRLHLDCKTSQMFIGNEETPSDFEWHCEKGIAFNAKKILQEFTSIHKLRPIKIIMESKAENMRFQDILTMISDHYRIPVINQEQIFKDAQDPNYVFPSEIQEDFNEYWPVIQEYINTKAPAQLSEQLKIYYKVIKWRLSQNDCQNRGFILQNFPNFFEEADYIFYPNKQKLKMKKKPKKKPVVTEEEKKQPQEPAVDENGDPIEQEQAEEQQQEEQQQEEQQEEEQQEEEQQEEEQEGGPKPEDFFPESYIVIKPLGKTDNFDYNRKLINFFSERNLDAYFIDPRKKTNHDTFEDLRIYIERNGRPYNYLQNEKELIVLYFNLQKIKDLTIKYTRKQSIQIWKEITKVKKDKRQDLVTKYTKYIQEQEQELQQVKQFPFRNYLMDFVVPVLNEGLVEVAHILPDDPVEFLAEYLYKRSFNVDNE